MTIKQFTPYRIDEVAQMAAEVWGKEQGAYDAESARLFCQHLTRCSLYTTDLAFQVEDEDGLQAIAFAWLPGDTNDAGQWLRERLPLMTEEQRHTLLTNEAYLKRTDEILQKMMLPNSAKLSFFISPSPAMAHLYWKPLSSGCVNAAWNGSIFGQTAPGSITPVMATSR